MPDDPLILDRATLASRIDERWRELRERVRHIGRSGVGERTPTGWTYKDLLAHVAAWEEEAARGLRRAQKDGLTPSFGSAADVDAFNARAIDERRLVGAEAILDELEAAHRQLMHVLATIDDGLLADEGIQRWIAGNTFNHYGEHRDELGAFTSR